MLTKQGLLRGSAAQVARRLPAMATRQVFGFIADRHHLAAVFVDGNHARFFQQYAFAFQINQRIRRAQIHSDIFGQNIQHASDHTLSPTAKRLIQ